MLAGSALAYSFPSTNELNQQMLVPGREGQAAPYVEKTSDGPGTLTLRFNNPAPGTARFEVKLDGVELTTGTAHPVVGDFIYPGPSVASGTSTDVSYSSPTSKVEVRLALGGERDWDFDWTTPFDVPELKCKPTGFNHPKENTPLTAAQIGGTVTGQLDAVGCDIGAYNPTSVTGATIHGALHYGIVANGGTLDVKNSTISDIGHTEPSMYGMQRGIGIFYTKASGTISGNTVSDYQKGGIVARDGGKVTINDNKVTGWGPTTYIAQNGVQVSYGTAATVKGNTISGHDYTPTDWTATGLLIYQAGGVKASANNLFDNEVNQYNGGKGGANVKP